MEGFDGIKVSPGPLPGEQQSTGLLHLEWFKSLSAKIKRPPRRGGLFILAEMEGFEPPHAFRRLADFESAPFSHLGTSP